MSNLWIPVIRRKGMGRGAWRGRLFCPRIVQRDGKAEACGAEKWKFVESLSPFRARYRCKVCGGTIQYDFSNNLSHPYEVFAKNKWQRIVARWKGTHPSGTLLPKAKRR